MNEMLLLSNEIQINDKSLITAMAPKDKKNSHKIYEPVSVKGIPSESNIFC